MSIMHDQPDEACVFVAEASATLHEARSAMVDLLVGAGLAGARATEVGRGLGLDKTLAWRLSRFVEDDDPVSAAKHLPGAGGVEIVLRAAARQGVERARIDAVREADRKLRAFVEQHAGDRRTFEAMLAGGARDPKLDLEERRAFFRAGSSIWGVRARTQFAVLVLRPSAEQPGSGGLVMDALQVSGFVGLERLRPDVPWVLRRLRVSTDNGKTMSRVQGVPLDPSGVSGGMPLMREFSSDPLPALRQVEGSNGWIYDELAPGAVGREGAVTAVSGEWYRGALPGSYSETNTFGRYMLMVRTPVEFVQFDLLVHESLSHFEPAVAEVIGLLEDRQGDPGKGGQVLIESHPALSLGSPPALVNRRIPKYARMVERGLEQADWEGRGAYRGYRVEMEYPAAPCELTLTCKLTPDR